MKATSPTAAPESLGRRLRNPQPTVFRKQVIVWLARAMLPGHRNPLYPPFAMGEGVTGISPPIRVTIPGRMETKGNSNFSSPQRSPWRQEEERALS